MAGVKGKSGNKKGSKRMSTIIRELYEGGLSEIATHRLKAVIERVALDALDEDLEPRYRQKAQQMLIQAAQKAVDSDIQQNALDSKAGQAVDVQISRDGVLIRSGDQTLSIDNPISSRNESDITSNGTQGAHNGLDDAARYMLNRNPASCGAMGSEQAGWQGNNHAQTISAKSNVPTTDIYNNSPYTHVDQVNGQKNEGGVGSRQAGVDGEVVPYTPYSAPKSQSFSPQFQRTIPYSFTTLDSDGNKVVTPPSTVSPRLKWNGEVMCAPNTKIGLHEFVGPLEKLHHHRYFNESPLTKDDAYFSREFPYPEWYGIERPVDMSFNFEVIENG